MKIGNKIDRVNTLLLMFFILLCLLFFNLYTLNKAIEDYSKNINQLSVLMLKNAQLNSVTDHFNQIDNYDRIKKNMKVFNKTYKLFRKNILQNYPEQEEIKFQLGEIEKKFDEKAEAIEYFKSLNASLVSGSHFLFDIQKSISKDRSINIDTKSKINETLFYLLRYMNSDYIDKRFLESTIAKVKKRSNSGLIKTFLKHTMTTMKTIYELKMISHEIKENKLTVLLEQLKDTLEKLHNESLYSLKMIVLLFFIFLLIALITFFISHYYFVKNTEKTRALNYAMQFSDNAIMITDRYKRISYVNDAFVKSTGYAKEEVLGKNPRFLKSDLMDVSFYKELNEKIEKGKKWEGEFINKRKDGSLFYEKASIVPVYINKELINYLAIKLDVTRYVEQNLKLQEAASVFEHTEEAIIITDSHMKITSVNQAFENIYGYTFEEVKSKELKFLHSGQHDQNFYESMWEEIKLHDKWQGKIINRRKDGTLIPVWKTIKVNRNDLGNIVSYIAVQTDLREIERNQKRIDFLAFHDALTGLHNRVSLEEYLRNLIVSSKRNKRMFALLFIDLDRFKIINDTMGHEAGDKLLLDATVRLKSKLRESDFIARWAGDEFIVVLDNIKSMQDVVYVAANILEVLQKPFSFDTREATVTASIGIALYPESATDPDSLIKNADNAMYHAKAEGKNNFQFYTKRLSEVVQRKLSIDISLSTALQNDEFYMVFQPQYDLENHNIVAAEALIRWESKNLGFVSPEEFIGIAEENGTIIEIGYFVFEESCKAYKQLREKCNSLCRIAINVSSIQFQQAELLEDFLTIAQKYKIEPYEIELELTERFVMSFVEDNIKILQQFREAGFKISIDDFGTGYSSMAYLKSLPVDTLKIDKSFIDDIGERSGEAIIKTIVNLAHNLEYEIVAEGIETEEQEKFLQKLHCEVGQGYFFAKPLNIKTIIEKFT